MPKVRGNGDGEIMKLSGKRKNPFAVRVTTGFDSNGKQLRKYISYHKTKTDAKKALSEYLLKPYSLEKETLMKVFTEWKSSHKLSESTFNNYEIMFKNLTYMHKKEFRKITLLDLEVYLKTLTPAMQKRYKSLMRNIYIYALRHDIVEKNLADLLELEKYDSKEKTIFSLKEIQKADEITTILLYTGVRINELLLLKSENVFIQDRYFVSGSKTKNGKNRKIPIHKNIVPIIKKYLSHKTEYLITKNGKPIKYNNYLKSDWQYENHTPHSTRHTFVTQMHKCKINRTVLQRIIGHSISDTTDIYTHLDFAEILKEFDKFSYTIKYTTQTN